MKHIFCLTSSKDDPFLNDDPDISWIYCDVRERNMVFDIVRSISPEYVFHLAALGAKNSISTYSLEPLFLINALGTQNLIDATMSVGSCKGFINVSTAYEYGPQNCSIHESTPFMPQGNYAISKIAGSLYLHEQIVKNHFP
jgi:nucleoside-diphosphate-sugar epimerase